MKRLLYIIPLVLVLNSCSEDSAVIPDPNNAPKVSAVPESFVQKVLIEQFTEASCGQCPKANLVLDSLILHNPGRVYGVAIHVDDTLSDTSLVQSFSGRNYLDSAFNPAAIYPSGMINRHISSLADISPDQWSTNVMTGLSHIPACGVALEAEALNGNTLTLTVHVGFSDDMFGDYRIHAYVVEHQVYRNDSTFDQMNDFSMVGATPDSTLSLYALDDTIHLYRHNNVLRKVITLDDVSGDAIPQGAMMKGNDFVKVYTVDLSTINIDNSYIIVFVDKYALTLGGHWIENVQSVNFGETQDWN